MDSLPLGGVRGYGVRLQRWGEWFYTLQGEFCSFSILGLNITQLYLNLKDLPPHKMTLR